MTKLSHSLGVIRPGRMATNERVFAHVAVLISQSLQAETCSAGRTRTYNQWINSPAHTIRPIQVGDVWCGPVYGFASVVLSGVLLSGFVRLHIWLQAKGGLVSEKPER